MLTEFLIPGILSNISQDQGSAVDLSCLDTMDKQFFLLYIIIEIFT